MLNRYELLLGTRCWLPPSEGNTKQDGPVPQPHQRLVRGHLDPPDSAMARRDEAIAFIPREFLELLSVGFSDVFAEGESAGVVERLFSGHLEGDDGKSAEPEGRCFAVDLNTL